MATILLSVAVLVVAVVLLAIRVLIVPGAVFRGTCASMSPYADAGGECRACGKSGPEEIGECEYRDRPARLFDPRHRKAR
jgi:hypothetical protein